jgi:two-component system chemotaxis response regulator CheB
VSKDVLRVLVVDDAVIYRKIVTELLAEVPEVEVVGSAANGKIALQKIEQLKPDLITLDLEMPEVDGLGVLRQLRAVGSPAAAIMLSSVTEQGAAATIAALELGAIDFVVKPSGKSIEENISKLRQELRSRIVAYARTLGVKRLLAATTPSTAAAPAPRHVEPSPAPQKHVVPPVISNRPPEVVLIGISTGGPKALTQMLPRLPAELPVPVLIVQHMPPVFTRSLANDLDLRCKLRVSEAEEGQPVLRGSILIAPGGRQMGLRREGDSIVARITDDPPENSCRPSVDYLFRSAVAIYGGNALAVIMTGMGSDGTAGCRLLRQRGARVIAQDEASCVVFGMPREPIAQGLVDVVAPLDRIATEIVRLTGGLAGCK